MAAPVKPRILVLYWVMSDPAPPFRFIGGDSAIDFVNTIDWAAPGPVNERLLDYRRLIDWALEAGTIGRSDATRLRALAIDRPREAAVALAEARRVRAALEETLRRVTRGDRGRAVTAPIDALVSDTARHLRLAPGPAADRWIWTFDDLGRDLRSLIRPVVWAGATLLGSDELDRLRRCPGADCGWYYVDRSRNGLRRWCQMETCGTREKSRRRRLSAAG